MWGVPRERMLSMCWPHRRHAASWDTSTALSSWHLAWVTFHCDICLLVSCSEKTSGQVGQARGSFHRCSLHQANTSGIGSLILEAQPFSLIKGPKVAVSQVENLPLSFWTALQYRSLWKTHLCSLSIQYQGACPDPALNRGPAMSPHAALPQVLWGFLLLLWSFCPPSEVVGVDSS